MKKIIFKINALFKLVLVRSTNELKNFFRDDKPLLSRYCGYIKARFFLVLAQSIVGTVPGIVFAWILYDDSIVQLKIVHPYNPWVWAIVFFLLMPMCWIMVWFVFKVFRQNRKMNKFDFLLNCLDTGTVTTVPIFFNVAIYMEKLCEQYPSLKGQHPVLVIVFLFLLWFMLSVFIPPILRSNIRRIFK